MENEGYWVFDARLARGEARLVEPGKTEFLDFRDMQSIGTKIQQRSSAVVIFSDRGVIVSQIPSPSFNIMHPGQGAAELHTSMRDVMAMFRRRRADGFFPYVRSYVILALGAHSMALQTVEGAIVQDVNQVTGHRPYQKYFDYPGRFGRAAPGEVMITLENGLPVIRLERKRVT